VRACCFLAIASLISIVEKARLRSLALKYLHERFNGEALARNRAKLINPEAPNKPNPLSRSTFTTVKDPVVAIWKSKKERLET
jgi:hypothetical protein